MNAPALVGRTSELARLCVALGDVERYGGAVIVGAAGTGRTRLAREALDHAAASGYPTAWVAGRPAGPTLPLGAMLRFIPDEPTLTDTLARMRAVATSVRSLRNGSSRIPVVAIDDAHLLDDASTAVVGDLIADRAVSVLLVLDAAESTLHSLTAGTDAPRVELRPLERPEADEMATHLLGGPVSSVTLGEIWRLTGGLPGLIDLVVGSARAAGLLERANDVWRHVEPLGLSRAAQTLAAEALNGLDSDHRDAAELIAVAQQLDLGVVEALVETQALDELERRNVITTDRTLTVRFASELVGHAVHVGLNPRRRRVLSRRVLEALETRSATGPQDELRVAALSLDAGTTAPPALLVRAAGHAHERYDFALAQRLASAALDRRASWEGHVARARARLAQDRADEAIKDLDIASHLARSEQARVEVAKIRADSYLLGSRDPDRAMDVIQSVLDDTDEDEHRLELLARKAAALAQRGDPAASSRIADELDPTDSTGPATAAGYLARSLADHLVGRPEAALDSATAGLDRSFEAAHAAPLASLYLQVLRTRALILLGRLDEAEQVARADHRHAGNEAQHDRACVAALTIALVLLTRGHAIEAGELLDEALAELRERDPLGLVPTALGARGYASALTGDLHIAQACAIEATDGAPAREPAPWVVRAQSWVAAQTGDLDSAVATILGALDAGTGQRLWGLELLHDLVRFGRTQAVVELDRAGASAGELTAAMSLHGRALREGCADELIAAAEAFAAVGADLLAAEAQSQAAGAHREAHRPGPAQRAAARARHLANRCNVARTPALGWAFLSLTQRERQVAQIAAKGTTSRAIADQLGISVRTVDNHLYRTYEKLGLEGRHELDKIF